MDDHPAAPPSVETPAAAPKPRWHAPWLPPRFWTVAALMLVITVAVGTRRFWPR